MREIPPLLGNSLPPLLLDESERGDVFKLALTKGELKHISGVGPNVQLFHQSPMRNTKVQVCYPSGGRYSQEVASLSLDFHSKPFC